MENQEMYKLGFELALRNAGFSKTAAVDWNAWFPTFRRWLGFSEGSAARMAPAQAKRIMRQAPQRTGAGVVRTNISRGRPTVPEGWGAQPENPYSVFKNKARATA